LRPAPSWGRSGSQPCDGVPYLATCNVMAISRLRADQEPGGVKLSGSRCSTIRALLQRELRGSIDRPHPARTPSRSIWAWSPTWQSQHDGQFRVYPIQAREIGPILTDSLTPSSPSCAMLAMRPSAGTPTLALGRLWIMGAARPAAQHVTARCAGRTRAMDAMS
jgi:hypothetical protein